MKVQEQDFILKIEDVADIEGKNSGANEYKVIGLKFFTEKENQFPESLNNMFEKHKIS